MYKLLYNILYHAKTVFIENERRVQDLVELNTQFSSVGSRLQPQSNNSSIGAILGKLCDWEDIEETADAKRPAERTWSFSATRPG
jgi:hypothetical protein